MRPFHLAIAFVLFAAISAQAADRPNIVFVLTDDHRWDGYGASGNERITTPNLDRIAASGTRCSNAFVTLAICSPSRAACLTGRYGSANGVTSVGGVRLREGEPTFARALRDAGYETGVAGKWHLKTTPEEAGFGFVSTCWSNGTWYDRTFSIAGQKKVMPGFVDDVAADESIRFMRQSRDRQKPFMLWLCTQVPHMDHKFSWPARQKYLEKVSVDQMPLPTTWNDDLSGKPEYLKTARNRTRALEYGYDKPENILRHTRDYYASVQQMDAAVGRVFDELDRLKLRDNTWIIFMGDNGWFLGEHGMTSKVLPYEESMRVPMAIAGPSTVPGVSDDLVLNIDLTATIYELAGLPVPKALHGRSLLPLVSAETPGDWRQSFLYEAPTPQLGSKPLWAVRNSRWKYIETQVDEGEVFAELYDLKADAIEQKNVANDTANQARLRELAAQLRKHKLAIAAPDAIDQPAIPVTPPPAPRTDLFISGVYPHLTPYGVYSQNGAHYKAGHNECGIGAIVPWAGKLWMVNYAPHMPRGSEHKLYSVDPDLTKPITVHPESVGGTPAGRMIHAESSQLLIGHHLIDANGKVRTISPKDMPIRVTAIARHLSDPKNMVYYVDMEGSIWEANVHTLEVTRLFKKPVPGWHGKGGYTSQGRLVVSNNGELHVGNYNDVLVGGKAKNEEERGVLAEFDGTNWRIVERRQFTEVTGPNGITGGSDGNDPVWTMGWDRRSVRLKVLDNGHWHTYLLPKAAFCNDASHGWYTEWPRIREITEGRWMMDMHGMFFDFPKTFSSKSSAGIKPIGSHLRYVPDFCDWNGKLVLATDETSIQGNELAGQPQSNLWFGSYDDLKTWGPASGFGGPWVEDEVPANMPSDPFLVDGFDRRVLHLAVGNNARAAAMRTSDQFEFSPLPEHLASVPRVTVKRGDWHQPANGYSFSVNQPATVFLSVDQRGKPKLDSAWQRTSLTLAWGNGTYKDTVYSREFPAGTIEIPGNNTKHSPIAYGMPHTAFVSCKSDELEVKAAGEAVVTRPVRIATPPGDSGPVVFSLQVDVKGDGRWVDHSTVTVPAGGYVSHLLPGDFKATWLRLKTSRRCVATAYLHQTSDRFANGNDPSNVELFAGLAAADAVNAHGALLYPAKRNRNLRVIAFKHDARVSEPHDTRNPLARASGWYEFTKAGFEFKVDRPDEKLAQLLQIEPEFTVDDASVILKHRGRNLRLPKGNSAFDKPFASGWPRATREVESERHLANIHGTFYEVPLITNGEPPAFDLMRPVASHSKKITDFCSWNGLLVLAGVRANAKSDGHVFVDPKQNVALWFGGVDDLWKLGKPVGRGGPWKDAAVKAGQPSDPYLMTGYDKKTLTLSADVGTTVTIEVDFDHQGGWHQYKSVTLQAGEPLVYEFPPAFSAHWIRFTSNRDCTATATLNYE